MKDILINILLVGLGGGAGSVCRYLITIAIERIVPTLFPSATFLVNIIGSFVIGVLMAQVNHHYDPPPSPLMSPLFIVGFLGGFTTFSAFAFEVFYLAYEYEWSTTIIYLLLSVILSIIAVTCGYAIAR